MRGEDSRERSENQYPKKGSSSFKILLFYLKILQDNKWQREGGIPEIPEVSGSVAPPRSIPKHQDTALSVQSEVSPEEEQEFPPGTMMSAPKVRWKGSRKLVSTQEQTFHWGGQCGTGRAALGRARAGMAPGAQGAAPALLLPPAAPPVCIHHKPGFWRLEAPTLPCPGAEMPGAQRSGGETVTSMEFLLPGTQNPPGSEPATLWCSLCTSARLEEPVLDGH